MEARLFRGREAELHDRVDRRRVRVVHAAEAEGDVVAAALTAFRRDLAALAATSGESDPDVARECETAGVPGGDAG
jgi:hypothetical protein